MNNEFYQLSPSILAADFSCLGSQIKQLEDSGCRWLHIDIMDGQFVPEISFGTVLVKSIRPYTNLFFDVHAMVLEPLRYVDELKQAGTGMLTIHAESCTHLDRTVDAVKEAGMKVGVALNPATPLDVLEYLVHKIDAVLIMTVNPGYGGQKFIPEMLQKIRNARKMLDDLDRKDVSIEVDGGINEKTINASLEAGANLIVAGSSIFKGNLPEITQYYIRTINNRIK